MSGSPALASLGLADRLTADATSVLASLRSPWTWLAVAIVVAVVVGSWRLRQALARERRLAPRLRSILTASVSAATLVVVSVFALWFLWRQGPLLTSIALAALAGAAGIAVGLRGRAWIWGLATIWRGRVRIGDRLRFEHLDGVVSEIGIFAIKVVSDDGEQIFIPTARIAGHAFAVSSPETVHPVQIVLPSPQRAITDGDIDLLRRIATLSPYRQADSVVSVSAALDRSSATVEFRSWSEEAAQLAHRHAVRAFADARMSAERHDD